MENAACGQTLAHFPQPMHLDASYDILICINPSFIRVTAPSGQTFVTGQKGDLSHFDSLNFAFFIETSSRYLFYKTCFCSQR
jgi:hypothetical protein